MYIRTFPTVPTYNHNQHAARPFSPEDGLFQGCGIFRIVCQHHFLITRRTRWKHVLKFGFLLHLLVNKSYRNIKAGRRASRNDTSVAVVSGVAPSALLYNIATSQLSRKVPTQSMVACAPRVMVCSARTGIRTVSGPHFTYRDETTVSALMDGSGAARSLNEHHSLHGASSFRVILRRALRVSPPHKQPPSLWVKRGQMMLC